MAVPSFHINWNEEVNASRLKSPIEEFVLPWVSIWLNLDCKECIWGLHLCAPRKMRLSDYKASELCYASSIHHEQNWMLKLRHKWKKWLPPSRLWRSALIARLDSFDDVFFLFTGHRTKRFDLMAWGCRSMMFRCWRTKHNPPKSLLLLCFVSSINPSTRCFIAISAPCLAQALTASYIVPWILQRFQRFASSVLRRVASSKFRRVASLLLLLVALLRRWLLP